MKGTLAYLPLMASLLLGCGTESEQDSNTNQNTAPTVTKKIRVYDKLAIAPLSTPTRLDLSAHIIGEDAVLSSIYANEPERCFAQVDNFLAISAEIASLGRCDYTFIAEDIFGQSAEGQLTLVTSDIDNPVIPSFSIMLEHSNFLEQKVASIDLKAQLTEFLLPENFVLDETSLKAYSKLSTNSLDGLQKTANLSLSFNIPKNIGWHTIDYVLNNATTNNTLIGQIFVNVGDQKNTAPLIKVPIFTYPKAAEWNDKTHTYQLEIHLDDVDCDENNENCLIEDEQPWRVTNAKAVAGANVSLPETSNLFTRSFSFDTRVTGIHEVSYIVSDNEGASSLGKLLIDATSEKINYDRGWKMAFSELDPGTPGVEYFFLAPLSHLEAKEKMQNEKYQHETINGETYLVSKWTKAEAQALCEASTYTSTDADGNETIIAFSLPKIESYNMIYQYDYTDDHIFANVVKNWPKNAYYFVSNENKVYDITDTNQNSSGLDQPDDNYQGYVTCAACIVLEDDMAKNCDI